jgi:hypothetical protein
MQMMISKEDFESLKEATSKNPLKPFEKCEHTDLNKTITQLPTNVTLPPKISQFIYQYLAEKIESGKKNGETIDRNSVRISVNEAPATHSKEIICYTENDVPIVLAGDAALGLSYFKGLNAGLESTAYFLSTLAPIIQEGFSNQDLLKNALTQHQTWFLKDFSPKKVREVAHYSTWRIRSAMHLMKAAQNLKMASIGDDDAYDPKNGIKDAFDLQDLAPEMAKNRRSYPHREYDLVKLGQFDHVPLKHTLLKIKKLFVDYGKPYKSLAQLKQDFRQPMVGLNHVFIGFLKIIASILILNFKQFSDGVFTVLRGILEIATTPLAWIIKPITRGLASLIRGQPKIENNTGLRKVVQSGICLLGNKQTEPLSPKEIYDFLAICNDLHRKFDKSIKRAQPTEIDQLKEHTAYSALRSDTAHITPEKVKHYLELFSTTPPPSGPKHK